MDNSCPSKLIEKISKADSWKGDPFTSACEAGKIKDVKSFIKDIGVDVNAVKDKVNKPGKTQDGKLVYPVHIAAQNGHFLIVQYLIVKGADLSITNDKGKNCLHISAYYNDDVKTINILLNNMEPDHINCVDNRGKTPLDLAYFDSDKVGYEKIKLIRSHSGKANCHDKDGKKCKEGFGELKVEKIELSGKSEDQTKLDDDNGSNATKVAKKERKQPKKTSLQRGVHEKDKTIASKSTSKSVESEDENRFSGGKMENNCYSKVGKKLEKDRSDDLKSSNVQLHSGNAWNDKKMKSSNIHNNESKGKKRYKTPERKSRSKRRNERRGKSKNTKNISKKISFFENIGQSDMSSEKDSEIEKRCGRGMNEDLQCNLKKKCSASLKKEPGVAKEVGVEFLPGNKLIFTYEKLKSSCPDGVKPYEKEQHLSVAEFNEIFGMDIKTFYELKKWQRKKKKQSVGLF